MPAHHSRPSKLRAAAHKPGDDADARSGGWSRERLVAMNERFRAAMERALGKRRPLEPSSATTRRTRDGRS